MKPTNSHRELIFQVLKSNLCLYDFPPSIQEITLYVSTIFPLKTVKA